MTVASFGQNNQRYTITRPTASFANMSYSDRLYHSMQASALPKSYGSISGDKSTSQTKKHLESN